MVKFTLKDSSRKSSQVIATIHMRGERYRVSTGVSVCPSDWNKSRQRVRLSADDPLKANLDNDTIDRAQAAIVRAVAHFKERRGLPSQIEFRQRVDIELHGEPEEQQRPLPPFTKYMSTYIERYRAAKKFNTTRAIITIYNILVKFEQQRRKKITFESIDMTFYAELSTWFAKQGYRDSYFATAAKVIKQVFRESRDIDKLHSYDGIDAKGFTSSYGEVDNIYLREDELRKIHDLDLSTAGLCELYPNSRVSDIERKAESLQIARAFFLLGAYTGLRVSDFTRLSSANITDRIRIRTQKTGSEVVIPIHPIVREILQSEIDITRPPSPQHLNPSFRELARLAKINQLIEITRKVGGEVIREQMEKWQLVSAHTTRRSFATNAYKAGVKPIAIMKITGHTKEATFMKYIKIGGEENADLLELHPFFSQ